MKIRENKLRSIFINEIPTVLKNTEIYIRVTAISIPEHLIKRKFENYLAEEEITFGGWKSVLTEKQLLWQI